MSDEQTKPRFFIEGDKVKHIKTGTIYTVQSSYSDDERDIFYEDCHVEVCLDQYERRSFIHIPFDELEIVESAGVYMGAGLKSPTYADGYMQGVGDRIKSGYVSSLRIADIPPSIDYDAGVPLNYYRQPKLTEPDKAHYHHARINANTWALFGALGIDTIQFVDNIAWVVHYQKSKSQSLEPRFARAFLDRLDLTEDYEPRIGNQDEWERVFNQEYPSDLDKLIDFPSPTPNYPDEPAE